MADSRPPKPLGYRPGETYIDMVTGQFKQVQVNGPDIVIPVAARAVEQQESPTTTTTAPAKPTNTKPNTQSSPGIKVSAKISDLLARVASIEARIEAIDNANLVPGRETEDVVEYIEPSTGTAVQSTANELRALLGSLNREKNEINKVLKPYSDAQKAYNEAQSGLLRAEEIARNPVTESPGGMSKKEADANVSSARKKVETARKQVDVSMRSVDSAETPKQTTPSTGAKTKPSAQTQTGTTTAAEAPKVTGAVTSMAKNPSARNRIGAGGGGMTGETGGGTGGGGGTGAGGNVGATTADTGKDGKKKKKGKGAAADVLAGLDLETLKRDYPGYAWVWDLAPEFNDTKKLWADLLNGSITADRFNNLIGQSSWYTDQRTINETRRIKNRYGDILDGGTLSKLVNESIVFQYKDDELDSAFFTSALSRNVMTGEFVDSRAANAALASNVANSYRNYAKSMFLSTDDTEVEALLTGKMTEEDFTRTKRQVAQATYKNWADLLNDPAMTMDKIVKPWKDMAASVLELDPTQIDMTKPQFSVAYAGTPDGKMGAMSLGDWYVKLRSDATYGWDKTNQAKQEAQELGYNIAKAFGKA